MSSSSILNDFSPHLFWDVDPRQLDLNKHTKFIVQRVLEYGLLKDWILLKNELGIDEIADVAETLRSLDPKSLSFIALLSKRDKNKFRCYTTLQSNPLPWNF